jgi:FixJ family two-component response regulator
MESFLLREGANMGRILVVDDERSIRITLKAFLEEEGHQVETAEDALLAIENLNEKPADVVFADIIMPKLSGVDLLQRIRDISPEALVIMMTGRPTLENATDSLRHGAVDYLQKPVSKADVFKSVRNALRIKFIEDEKKRLEHENQKYMHNLEQMVAERTQKLTESEAVLRNRAVELDQRALQLEKANMALSAMLEHREAEKRAIEETLHLQIKKYILPNINDLARREIDREVATRVQVIKKQLENLVSSSARSLFVRYQDLTPTEIRVADFIREDMSTKDIADAIGISPGSVSFHRNSIRRKLGLVKKKDTLKSFLNRLS